MIMVTTVMPNDDHNDRLVAGRPPTAKVIGSNTTVPTRSSYNDITVLII